MKLLRFLIAATLVAFLGACGGGGSASSYFETDEGDRRGEQPPGGAAAEPAAAQPQASWKVVASQRINYGGTVLSSAALQHGPDLVVAFGGPAPGDVAHLCPTYSFNVVRFSTAGVSAVTLPGAVHPREMVAADFNGDGAADLFSANRGCDADPAVGERNSLLLSQVGGGYALANHLLPADRSLTHSAAAGDVDGDGDNDIVVVPIGALGAAKIGPYVLRNDGATFTRVDVLHPSITWVSSSMPTYTAVELVDVDADGKLDLILGGAGNGSVAFLNVGGAFTGAPIPLPRHLFDHAVVSEIRAITLKGRMTLLVAQSSSQAGEVHKGARVQALQFVRGAFVEVSVLPASFSSSQAIQFMHVADIDGDGLEDVVLQSEQVSDGGVFALTGTGEGKLAPAARAALPETVDSLMAAKLNGKTLLVSAKRAPGVVTVNVYERQ